MSPFKSEPGAKNAGVPVADLQRQLTVLEQTPDLEERHSKLERFVARYPGYAMGHYVLGRTRYALGEHEPALVSLKTARDEDIVPLRLTERLAETLRQTAEGQGVPLLDFEALLRAESRRLLGHEVLGDEMFLDHVHPTLEAHRLLALAIVDWMAERDLLRPGADWNDTRRAEVSDMVRGRIGENERAEAFMMLGKVMTWARKREEGHRNFQKAHALSGGSPATLTYLARSAAQLGRWDEVTARFQSAFRSAKDQEGVFSALDAFLKSQPPSQSSAFLEALVARAPANAALSNLLGSRLADRGRLDLAAHQFSKAVALEPDNVQIRYNLAMALSELGRFKAAIPHFRAVTRQSPENALAFNNLGVALASSQRLVEAVPALRRALKLDPSLENARINLQAIEAHLARTAR